MVFFDTTVSQRLRTVLSSFVVMALLAGCSIGEGNTINRIEVRASNTDVPHEVFTCFLTQLRAVGIFDNGGEGIYNSRSTWSSSDPAVARVSNGDIPLPSGDGNYARGIVIPVTTGLATISVEYLGLKASLDIEVRTGSVEVWPQAIPLAQGLSFAMRAVGILDGKNSLSTIDATSLVDWSVTPAVTPDESVSIVENGFGAGILSAESVTAGSGTLEYTVKADPGICDTSAVPASDLTTSTVTVDQSPLAGLTFYDETDLAAPITSIASPEGTQRGLRVFGNYGSLNVDLTTLATFSTSDDGVIGVPGFVRNGVINFISDASATSATVTATVEDGDSNTVTADLTATIDGFVVDPSISPALSLTAPYTPALIIPGTTLNLAASAGFCDPADCSNIKKQVNLIRDVTWFLGENDTIGGVQTNSGFEGQAFTGSEESGTFSITARFSDPATDPATDYDSTALALKTGTARVNSLTIEANGGACPVTVTTGQTAKLRVIAAIDLLDESGNITDSSNQDVSSQAVWSSSAPAEVFVYNSPNDNRFFGPNPGDTLRLSGNQQTITATLLTELAEPTTPLVATCVVDP